MCGTVKCHVHCCELVMCICGMCGTVKCQMWCLSSYHVLTLLTSRRRQFGNSLSRSRSCSMESSSRFPSRPKKPRYSPSRSGSPSRSCSSVVSVVTRAFSFDFAIHKLQTTVTSSGAVVEDFLLEVLSEDGHPLLVGLDCEYCHPDQKKIAILQICVVADMCRG